MDKTTHMGITNHRGGAVSHTCNCVGCCRDCGGCITAPWHTLVCAKITDLERRKNKVYRDAIRTLKRG